MTRKSTYRLGCAALALCVSTLATTASAQAQTRTSGTPLIPNLVNVDLRNVLNNLAVNLHLDRANVPINIQLPVQLAANVCGVSVNVLSVSTGGQANCTATSAPQSLTQAVQQQMAAGGSVGGGAQSSVAANSGTASSGSASGGASGTSATSTGANTAPATTASAAPSTGTTGSAAAAAPTATAQAPAPRAPAPATGTAANNATAPAPTQGASATAANQAPTAPAASQPARTATGAAPAAPATAVTGTQTNTAASAANPNSAAAYAPGHRKKHKKHGHGGSESGQHNSQAEH